MEYDLNAIVEHMVEKKLEEKLEEIQQKSGKTRFTAKDISERLGIHIDTARMKIRCGEFGPYINVGKHKVVTLQGVLDYEDKNTREPGRKPTELRHNNRKPKTMPGRI